MKCFVCEKELEITKSDLGSRVVQGGIWLSLDVDEGSRFYDLQHRMKASKEKPLSFFTRLIFANQITGVICDDCFEKKHQSCFGTVIEVKRSYQDIYPDGTTLENKEEGKDSTP